MSRHPLRLAAVTALFVLTGAYAAVAQSSESSTVDVTTIDGTRSLNVTTLSGANFGSTELGPNGEVPFAVNVTDVLYDRTGYQVTSTLTDLYAVTESGLDCGTSVPASEFSVGFLADPTQVTDVLGLVDSSLTFTGDLTSLGLGALGLTDTTLTTTVDQISLQDLAQGGGPFEGLEALLPMTTEAGAGGTFAAAATHGECGGGSGSPTDVLLMSGDVQNELDLTTWLTSGLDTVFTTAAGDGVLTPAEAVTAGLVEQSVVESAVRDALIALGADGTAITQTIIGDVLGVISADALDLGTLLRQSGVYTTLAELQASALDSYGAGTFRGTMTVTLVDTP